MTKADQPTPTVEFTVNLLRPSIAESLHAVGEVILAGRSLSIGEVPVSAIDLLYLLRAALGPLLTWTVLGRCSAPGSYGAGPSAAAICAVIGGMPASRTLSV